MPSKDTEPTVDYASTVARELGVHANQVRAVAELFSAGATVPFIARYRKEATGSLDELAVTAVRDRLARLGELDKRREAILSSLSERDLLDDDLRRRIEGADTLQALEDVYLPYRPKRRTRAMAAREAGLEPLAGALVAQTGERIDLSAFEDREEALAGARDIIAEQASENPTIRTRLRTLFAERGLLRSRVTRGSKESGAKYRDYFEWEEAARRAPSHRILAVMRGADEGFLSLHLLPNEEDALRFVFGEYGFTVSGGGRKGASRSAACEAQLGMALEDSYRRLLAPSMETEAVAALKERADREAIAVFSASLRELLLSAPLGQKRVLALDPGMRTGCKLVCLDAQGNLLHNETIYPLPPVGKTEEAARRVKELCKKLEIEAVAVGNGTGGRETIGFLDRLDLPGRPPVVMVNESGASVYSASKVAREEFPDQDVTVRGAVSIGRRLMDPLAELVKIDPKSIGVGQYQHDVDQRELKRALDDVVTLCVNAVGVEVNTASKELLSRVSGLTERLAGSLVAFRRENGPFRRRKDFLKVPGMGPKSFEQAAGFLRIRGAENPLDASAVHPESYSIVEAMARDLLCSVADLVGSTERRRAIDLKSYVTETVGLPTLGDILAELEKPGRDPRESFEPFSFADGIEKLEDLKPGMQLPGIVTNITAFGAFVDVGVHQDGLVHISAMSERFVRDPHEIVKVGQKVKVTVLEVDLPRRRIALSMKG